MLGSVFILMTLAGGVQLHRFIMNQSIIIQARKRKFK